VLSWYLVESKEVPDRNSVVPPVRKYTIYHTRGLIIYIRVVECCYSNMFLCLDISLKQKRCLAQLRAILGNWQAHYLEIKKHSKILAKTLFHYQETLEEKPKEQYGV
jgi:hypothetical protein